MDTLLFDLDGTLLPMEQAAFMRVYFGALVKKCAEVGFTDPDAVRSAVWKGTAAMVANNGSRLNEEVFWQVFGEKMGEKALALKPELELFYVNEFNVAKSATRQNPYANQLLSALYHNGYTLVLATNPLFPLCAVQTRLAWLGLSPDLFHYVTTYENSRFCKPNLAYYRDILAKIEKSPADCLMIGNDVVEDACATQLGMDFFLVTDSILNAEGMDISRYNNGSFADCCAYVKQRFI